MEAIKVTNLKKQYGKKIVLENVNLKIKAGEVLGIVGANGSGKSSFIDLLQGMIKKTSGEIIVDKNVCFGTQFQNSVWPVGTKIKDVIHFFNIKDRYDPEKYNELIGFFDLKEIWNLYINQLSGGQQQRLNCFLAVANNANFIIFDELITGLDMAMQMRLINFIKREKQTKTKTIILVSHLPEEIEMLTDRFLLFNNKTIQNTFETKEIVQSYGSVRSFLMNYYLSKRSEVNQSDSK